jgi:hypothetical protein
LAADLTTLKKVRRVAGNAKRSIKTAVFGPFYLRVRLAAARRAGFEFHQRAVRSQPKLLDWVQRPDYWDFRLPQ